MDGVRREAIGRTDGVLCCEVWVVQFTESRKAGDRCAFEGAQPRGTWR
jgi:hypothetical protein